MIKAHTCYLITLIASALLVGCGNYEYSDRKLIVGAYENKYPCNGYNCFFQIDFNKNGNFTYREFGLKPLKLRKIRYGNWKFNENKIDLNIDSSFEYDYEVQKLISELSNKSKYRDSLFYRKLDFNSIEILYNEGLKGEWLLYKKIAK